MLFVHQDLTYVHQAWIWIRGGDRAHNCTNTANPKPTFKIPVAGTGPMYSRCKQFLVAPFSKTLKPNCVIDEENSWTVHITGVYFSVVLISFHIKNLKSTSIVLSHAGARRSVPTWRRGTGGSLPSPHQICLLCSLSGQNRYVKLFPVPSDPWFFSVVDGSRIHRNWKRFQDNFLNWDTDSDSDPDFYDKKKRKIMNIFENIRLTL